MQDNGSSLHILSMAFDWAESKEGVEFWSRVNDLWIELCCNIEDYNNCEARLEQYQEDIKVLHKTQENIRILKEHINLEIESTIRELHKSMSN